MFPGLDETEEIRRVPYTNFRSSALLFGFVRGPQYPLLRATDFSSVTSAVSLGVCLLAYFRCIQAGKK